MLFSCPKKYVSYREPFGNADLNIYMYHALFYSGLDLLVRYTSVYVYTSIIFSISIYPYTCMLIDIYCSYCMLMNVYIMMMSK